MIQYWHLCGSHLAKCHMKLHLCLVSIRKKGYLFKPRTIRNSLREGNCRRHINWFQRGLGRWCKSASPSRLMSQAQSLKNLLKKLATVACICYASTPQVRWEVETLLAEEFSGQPAWDSGSSMKDWLLQQGGKRELDPEPLHALLGHGCTCIHTQTLHLSIQTHCLFKMSKNKGRYFVICTDSKE